MKDFGVSGGAVILTLYVISIFWCKVACIYNLYSKPLPARYAPKSWMLHSQTQSTWLVVPDTDSHMTCSTNTDSRVTCSTKYGFHKLHAAARLPHWFPYISVRTYDKCRYSQGTTRYFPFQKKSIFHARSSCYIGELVCLCIYLSTILYYTIL